MSKLGDVFRAAAEAADSAERYADNHAFAAGKLVEAARLEMQAATLMYDAMSPYRQLIKEMKHDRTTT